jgi:cellulose synthase/poly-beta-1,6-N-acetylglucosamine synthase-like glycosyltransferase
MLLLYTWILYPTVTLLAWKRTCSKEHDLQHKAPRKYPHVCIIISAWNEAEVISNRIKNLTSLDYPTERLSVFIGTDGCTDNTATIARQIARTCPQYDIHIEEFTSNRGKASVIVDLANMASQRIKTDHEMILVFTDANTHFEPQALSHLLSHFDNPLIGGVCGRLQFIHPSNQPEQTYWSFETKLKEVESHFDSCLGANGAIYAVRPTCFWNKLPPETIIDDFMIGMKVREAGLLMKYEPHAIATEELPATRDEWHRRVRIGAGDYQALLWSKACLHPRYGKFSLFFWSHKVFRWFTPHAILLLVLVSIIHLLFFPAPTLPERMLPMSVLCMALAVFLVMSFHDILIQHLPEKAGQRLNRLHHFIMMQAALFVGFIRFCRGNLRGSWKRTPRSSQENVTNDESKT